MGSFTTIIRPTDGKELQIKTGGDVCDTYNLGDEVQWDINKFWPGTGTLLDGIYSSYSSDGPDDYVVIKDHKVHAILSRNIVEQESFDWDSLNKEYGIEAYKREWWTEEQWKEHEVEIAKIAKDRKDFEKSIEHLSAEDKFNALIVRSVSRRFNYAEIARNIIQIEPMPQGAPLYYEYKNDENKDK